MATTTAIAPQEHSPPGRNALIAVRLAFGAIAVAIVLMGSLVFSTFYSRYYFVRATWGVHSQEEYERRLRRSIELDPMYGEAHLRLGQVLRRQGNGAKALEHQRVAMTSFVPYDAYEEVGRTFEAMKQPVEARQWFERAARLNPGNVRPLEWLALLAVRQRDADRADMLAAEILRLDMNNLNALFLRARTAELRRNADAALLNYQRIAAALAQQQSIPAGLLFKPEEIKGRVQQLMKVVPR